MIFALSSHIRPISGHGALPPTPLIASRFHMWKLAVLMRLGVIGSGSRVTRRSAVSGYGTSVRRRCDAMYTRRPAVWTSVPLRESDLYLLHETSLRIGEFSYWKGKEDADAELKSPLWEINMHTVRCHTCRLPFRKGFVSGSISCCADFLDHRVAVMAECLLRCTQVGFLCNSPLSNLQLGRRLGYLVRL